MSKFRPVQLLAIPAIAFLGRVAGASWGPRQVGEVSTSLASAYVSFPVWETFFRITDPNSCRDFFLCWDSAIWSWKCLITWGHQEKEYEFSKRDLTASLAGLEGSWNPAQLQPIVGLSQVGIITLDRASLFSLWSCLCVLLAQPVYYLSF